MSRNDINIGAGKTGAGEQHVVKRFMVALLCATACAGAFAANVAPSVSMTGPAAAAPFIGPASVTLTATAADSDGTISKVVFYKGTTILATVTTAPYTYNWTNVVAGSYSITAKATDNALAVTTSSPLAVNVAANVLPTVSIINSPANASLIGPATVALSASAADSDGTITKVQYYNGATSIGSSTTAPYAINWANVAAGTYSVTAKATDDKGGVTTSAPTTIVVNVNVLPTVTIDAPLDNSVSVAPSTIGLRSTAADSDGTITKVQYFNGTTSIAVATVAPYFVNWNSVAAGTYTVTAKATDNKGGVTTSAPVRLVVNPNVPATVSITTPVTGTTYAAPGIIALAAAAGDTDGNVAKVQYYNGATLIATVTTAPYAYSWTNVAIGTYSLTAKATDDKGAVTTSNPVSVTVQANVAPTVNITAPAANAVFAAPATMTLAANAADSDGRVTKVAFYNGATLIGTDTTAPFSVNWTNVAIGNYSVTAVATDDKGLTTTSAAIPVSVKVNTLPTVSITAPAANASLGGPTSVTLSAAAADTDGTISKVDFYNGAVLVGSATVAPYSVNWANVAIGNYSISAKATDDKGGVTTSTAVAMSVKANVAPAVAITSPANNASFAGPAMVTVTANASDADGAVSKVEFYNGTTLIGTATTAPFAITWNNVEVGAYTITAKANDNLGLATVSAVVSVNVTGTATQAYFIHTDQIDTARLITDQSGQAVWTTDLEPFGANPPNENPVGRGTFTYNQRFPGQYFDRETGLHYNYHRDYDPQTGRYVESDPIGLAGGVNTYGYVKGNPIRYIDPLGLVNFFVTGGGYVAAGTTGGELSSGFYANVDKTGITELGALVNDSPEGSQSALGLGGGLGAAVGFVFGTPSDLAGPFQNGHFSFFAVSIDIFADKDGNVVGGGVGLGPGLGGGVTKSNTTLYTSRPDRSRQRFSGKIKYPACYE
jgi:RHS repeat-associated protein